MVLVVAAVAAADLVDAGDQLDPLDPLDLLEPELHLVAQPQRGAVAERQRFAVHVEGQHGQLAAHLLDRMGVVVDAAVGTLAERVEDDPLGVGVRLDQIEDRRHRHPSPLGHAGPPLDAEVLGDLLVGRQGAQVLQTELDRMFDPPADLQPVVDEPAVGQGPVLSGVGVATVVPEVRRDVGLVVLAGLGVDVSEPAFERADQGGPHALDHPGVAQRERGRGPPGDADHDHGHGEHPEPDPAVVVAAGEHVVEVVEQAGGEHHRHVHGDEDQEPDHHEEVQGPGELDGEHLADAPEPRRQRR